MFTESKSMPIQIQAQLPLESKKKNAITNILNPGCTGEPISAIYPTHVKCLANPGSG